MAATRRNAMLIEEARNKIRTTQLINRLQDHGLGKIQMEPSQVKAIEILLRKSVPDLSAHTLEGPNGGPIQTSIVTAEPMSDEEWERSYGHGLPATATH